MTAPNAPTATTLWTPYRHGAKPVRVTRTSRSWNIEVLAQDGSPERAFESCAAFLRDAGLKSHLTLPQFFKTGAYASKRTRLIEQGPSISEMIDLLTPTLVTDPGTLLGATVRLGLGAGSLVVDPNVPVLLPETLGIDLKGRHTEVAKLLFAGFGSKIYASGYDPDEVLQEVYRGLLARNAGRCAWDGRKSSFGHYVHMVCDCVLKNWHRREAKHRSVMQTGLPTWEDGSLVMGDAADGAKTSTVEHCFQSDYLTEDHAAQDLDKFLETSPGKSPSDARLARRLLPLVQAGKGRTEISDELEIPKTVVSRGLTYLRERTRAWVSGRQS